MKVLTSTLAGAAMLALLSGRAGAALDDAKAQELLKKGGCMTCHTLDKKSMGPSFKDVAQKRKGQADAIAVVVKNVRDGSKGIYGAMPMPPSAAKLSDAEVHELVEWVLTR